MPDNESLFSAFLNQHDEAAWAQVIADLLPAIHPVDAVATRLWFAFFPLKLHHALEQSPDPAKTAEELLLKGKYRLADQVDASAEFLYGHRYWPEVKRTIREYASGRSVPKSLSLAELIREIARQAAERVGADDQLLVGISAVALMTLQQVGWEAFSRSYNFPSAPPSKKSPEQILQERARDDGQGIFGFLKSVDKKFTVTFSERDPKAKFPIINMQDLTMAAANDKRDYRSRDPRCIEGPIPVECRTAACGTCWVGILSPTEKLSEPTTREVKKMKEFGYRGFTPDRSSIIRLACQTRALGNVTIVIPPWCGVIGKLYEQN